jgi:hypothetical protein
VDLDSYLNKLDGDFACNGKNILVERRFDMLQKLYKVMDDGLLEDFNLDCVYLKLECLRHNYSWGCTIHRNQILESKLKCQYCLQEENSSKSSEN